jgi:hypothetical protein
MTSEDLAPRFIPSPPPISPGCDSRFWQDDVMVLEDLQDGESRSFALSSGFTGKNQESHVLLAACGVEEYAWEKREEDGVVRRGVFTKALMEVLAEGNYGELTYTSLMRKTWVKMK